jgi:hypothetical protein
MTEQESFSAIDAAIPQNQGERKLAIIGRKIVFKTGYRQCTWSHLTGNEA